jgi:hypothetical protein
VFTNVVKLLAVVTLVGSFGVWIYAFSGAADRDPPDLLDDASWSEAAEAICSRAVADVEQLPGAIEASDVDERSAQVRAATDRFAEMLVELELLPTSSNRDAQITTDWLADWRTLTQDRYRYADRILDDPAAPFTITDIGVGERLDRRITRMATTNLMPSCGSPTDV